MKYCIKDWTGRELTPYYGLFDSFEDAWGKLYETFHHLNDNEFDEQMGEFYVEEYSGRVKDYRFLDPNDIRKGL